MNSESASRGALRFDWIFTLGTLWWSAGVICDAWAHMHLDLGHEGFFTPYHALLYTGYLATAAVMAWKVWTGMRAGASFREAIPAGYGPSVAGLVLFAFAGFGDMLWHIAFGIELGISALLSPTHLLLFFAGSLAFLGPVRALVARGGGASLAEELPALLGFVFFLDGAGFLGEWTTRVVAGGAMAPAVRFPHLDPFALSMMTYYQLSYGVLTLVVRGLLLAGVALYVARSFPPRTGALTLVFGLNAALMTLMRYGADPLALTLAPSICTGLAADLAIAVLDPAYGPLWKLQVIGFLVPVTFSALTLAIVGWLFGGFWWEVHAIFGAAVLSGFTGLLIASIMQPQPRPASPSAA